MPTAFEWLGQLGPAGPVFQATIGSLIGITALLGFILVRRAFRKLHLRRRDARTYAISQQWDAILSGAVSPGSWRFNPMDREIVEAILLQSIEAASPAQLPALLHLLRSSGLLNTRIYEARIQRGWKRRRALVSLGRMRAPEAIPAIAEALDDPDLEMRTAAVRGLGQTRLPEGAAPLLEGLIAGELNVPHRPVQAALLDCCRSHPAILVPYLRRARGLAREQIARVLGELATPEMQDDLLLLAGDPLPEVRASAARALAGARRGLALPTLAAMATDPEWFVRLRAVAGLSALEGSLAIRALVAALCDPNRQVRLRAAAALARQEASLEEILVQVVETHDRYALQAMVSELERSGSFPRLMEALMDPEQWHTATPILLKALGAGSRQLEEALADGPKSD